MTITSILN